jgi:hypothetical protein
MTRVLIGTILAAALAFGWVLVQRAWWRVFERECPGADALGGRPGCGASCRGSCERGGER